MTYSLKIYKNNKVVKRVVTHFLRRFTHQTRTINWQDSPLKVYLKVNYGKHDDCDGKITDFWNDGDYETKRDFQITLKAFLKER